MIKPAAIVCCNVLCFALAISCGKRQYPETEAASPWVTGVQVSAIMSFPSFPARVTHVSLREAPNVKNASSGASVMFHITVQKADKSIMGVDGVVASQQDYRLLQSMHVGETYIFPDCLKGLIIEKPFSKQE